MTEKEAVKQAELTSQETVTIGVSMCDVCLDLDTQAIRVTNNLSVMKPTTNICKKCLKRLLEKASKTI